MSGAAAGEMSQSNSGIEEYVTIHHIDMREYRELEGELRYGEQDYPTPEEFEAAYEPAETVLATSDISEAYHRAQGAVVNEQQNARHMVRSSMPTDVYEVVDGDTTELYMVEPFGFVEIEWDEDDLSGDIDGR